MPFNWQPFIDLLTSLSIGLATLEALLLLVLVLCSFITYGTCRLSRILEIAAKQDAASAARNVVRARPHVPGVELTASAPLSPTTATRRLAVMPLPDDWPPSMANAPAAASRGRAAIRWRPQRDEEESARVNYRQPSLRLACCLSVSAIAAAWALAVAVVNIVQSAATAS